MAPRRPDRLPRRVAVAVARRRLRRRRGSSRPGFDAELTDDSVGSESTFPTAGFVVRGASLVAFRRRRIDSRRRRRRSASSARTPTRRACGSSRGPTRAALGGGSSASRSTAACCSTRGSIATWASPAGSSCADGSVVDVSIDAADLPRAAAGHPPRPRRQRQGARARQAAAPHAGVGNRHATRGRVRERGWPSTPASAQPTDRVVGPVPVRPHPGGRAGCRRQPAGQRSARQPGLVLGRGRCAVRQSTPASRDRRDHMP